GYPGAEDAAAAYVQCHLTRADGVQAYGENPEVTSYVSEAVEVDGQDGWMVRGVVEVAEDGQIATYTAVEIVAVVVETPSGPAVFKVATSADDPAMNADLESMVDSLSVAWALSVAGAPRGPVTPGRVGRPPSRSGPALTTRSRPTRARTDFSSSAVDSGFARSS